MLSLGMLIEVTRNDSQKLFKVALPTSSRLKRGTLLASPAPLFASVCERECVCVCERERVKGTLIHASTRSVHAHPLTCEWH